MKLSVSSGARPKYAMHSKLLRAPLGRGQRGLAPMEVHPAFDSLVHVIQAGCTSLLVCVVAALLACGHGSSDVSSGSTPISPPPTGDSNLTALWANDGGDKVPMEDVRATANAEAVKNSAWDGTTINLFGAQNEVVSFCLVLEAGTAPAQAVSVSFQTLAGPGGATISGKAAAGDALFDWRGRNIELFYVRYLPIKGLSLTAYGQYDERHAPQRFQRPWTGEGIGSGTWTDRPDHDKSYPEIAVPLELVPAFTIAAGHSQCVWADVYIPKLATPGTYSGQITVSENGTSTHTVPVSLVVRNFTLPDEPASKTMLCFSCSEIGERYLGNAWPNPGTDHFNQLMTLRNRHFLMAHRHKISLIDGNDGTSMGQDLPVQEWSPMLDGSGFASSQGYDGPGVGVGNNLFSIGTYGAWNFASLTESQVWSKSDTWEGWFQTNAPDTERFVYLIDESSDFAQTETWAGWMRANSGVGGDLPSFATLSMLDAVNQVPSLSVAASTMGVGDTIPWQNAHDALKAAGKRTYMYNGARPATGSWCTEVPGAALRMLPWTQYKKGIDRWFFWESTYYNNFQAGTGNTDVFTTAATFGGRDTTDPIVGETGWNHGNGDGVLFYPGTDVVFPASSYDLAGPLASLRMKHWRRGIQDVDYLTLAAAKDASATQAIVQRMVPKVLWEVGVSDPSDPTWVRGPINWSENPDDWEQARSELADIIEGP